jgi:proteasome lid subunit RPN8/RPN11
MTIKRFTVQLRQYIEEVCEIVIEAESEEAAEAIAADSIERNMIDEEYDLDWRDGNGTHSDGVEIDLVSLRT